MSEKKSIYLDDLAKWLEQNRQGFYLGCRVDAHSPQINEFVDALHYYLEKDFGFVSKHREKVKEYQAKSAQQNNQSVRAKCNRKLKEPSDGK